MALVFEDEELTYTELNQRANQLAHHLQCLGVGPEVLVGICLSRSIEMVVGLLGVLKAGGAYVPLDPKLPQERLAFLLEDAQVTVVLTQAHLRDAVGLVGSGLAPNHKLLPTVEFICLESGPSREGSPLATAHLEQGGNPPCRVRPANLAYLIYTSGSTGQPKGVQIPHHAVINFLTAMSRQLGVQASDTLLAVTSVSFDIAGLELFLPLLTGARVAIASREVAMNGDLLAHTLCEHDTTVMQATPSTWHMLLGAHWQVSSNIRVLCGGEAFPAELARQLLGSGVAVWNLYGPTETTIWSALYPVASVDGPLPIGRPIANTQIYLLDRNLQPVPIGVAGELYIGGVGLARGYARRPELTAEKFIANPFGKIEGERMYSTGDLARYRSDGAIEYLGRMDQQVKLRGFRIELGEIETMLSQHPDVQESVVVLQDQDEVRKHLMAYVVPRDRPSLGETGPQAAQLQGYLRKHLPDYMIPTSFVFLEMLPLTANGKVDRKALPVPDRSQFLNHAEIVAPQTPLQEHLAHIWAELLQLPQVGIHDNFFELGGHSLLATRLMARLRTIFQIEIPLRRLFEAPTIVNIALVIEQIQSEQVALAKSEEPTGCATRLTQP